MSRFGAGIRRGVMAADQFTQFTQVANGLFRDSQLSFKAKGIFGYVSTHANGWQVTIADLVRLGPDGREAVRTGLQELEAHGYLIRERLRRPDGTLGEIVYCITDRPATLDFALIEAQLAIATPEAGHAGGFRAGICRGVMAADQFTQIANGLFRTPELSYKAKGLFGLLSTHREGWRMTVTDIARRGRDGESAIKSGLRELEKHGFLVRERERGEDGTLGAAAYVITDLPALQNGRSQPESGFPPVDDPTLADRPTKNTISQKTNKQKTSSIPPCAPGERTSGRAAVLAQRTVPPPQDLDPGTRLLLSIGSAHPELLLQEKALYDQGRVVTAMLDAGWSGEQLRYVITSRPLPSQIRTSVGAIVAARLRSAQLYPPATASADDVDPGEATWTTAPFATQPAAARTVDQAITYRALVECAGCGRPGTAPGEDLCPTCLDWPLCRTCPGPTPRRAHPDADGRCATCTSALTATDLHLEASNP
ncbi:hypothetical protein AQJ46_48000 [Streptomyces canus]|uniref:DNA-binding protein n=1 Tax=Streptomyces canus TaxID=58343 RepID=A0A101RKZ3_9ACTN|nr:MULTISPECIES: hypothetical protein [Streptomyces]KUN57238.1 hypothetical protein AQJ46_48000 [Streptomyces canus]MDI5907019.1 hypothetical protein [Streptomyces sp. 12257]